MKSYFLDRFTLRVSLFGICFGFSSVFGQIIISEVSSKNEMEIETEGEEYPDWVELHNVSDDTISLEEYFLSDRLTDIQKWNFGKARIFPDQYLLEFASSDDKSLDCNKTHSVNVLSEVHTTYSSGGSNSAKGNSFVSPLYGTKF